MFDIVYSDSNLKTSLEKCKTRYLWVLDKHTDYSDFDLAWEPPPWESNFITVWPSQHQEHGGTMLVPCAGAEHKLYKSKVLPRTKSAPRLHIKHLKNSKDEGDVNTRYISDYLGTMRRALGKTEWEYCWVTSDVCTYTDFDFTWHPSEWHKDMLHVFASNEQKFGDTFYVHVPTFLEKTKELEVLEYFETLHFVEDIKVKRYMYDTVQYTSDSLVDAVWDHNFEHPLTLFYRGNKMVQPPTVSLWQERTKTVVPLNKGGGCTLVPREAKNYLKTQLYDYPWIDNTKKNLIGGEPLDIVFISNGESNAERNWEHLCKSTQTIQNRVVRVDGVKGRAEAYRAAVEASNTDWAFCVFAKLDINPEFDWSWQPDRLQSPKHYIFHAKNPVNGLVYGHMAMIAYNKQLTLSTEPTGLDFTLDSEHEVVPILSGVARYADDPWIAWRSAFRECVKLKHSLPDIENEYRLQQWLNNNLQGGAVGEWSRQGASDAIEYYDSVQGSFDALKLTYEWDWLAKYLNQKHNLSPDQLCTQFQDQLVQDKLVG